MKAVRVNGSILQCWRSSFSRSSFFCRRAIVGEPPGTDASKPCWPEGRQRWTSPHFAETLIAFFVGQTASFRPPSAPAVWKRRSCQWQSSSGVEQRTHKPLVGGSIPPSGTISQTLAHSISKQSWKCFFTYYSAHKLTLRGTSSSPGVPPEHLTERSFISSGAQMRRTSRGTV